MYPISDELKKLFLDGNKKCVKLTLNGVSFENDVITEADVLSDSLTVDRYCSSGNKIEVGSAIAAELTLTLVNNNEKFGDKIFEGADVALEIGIEGVSDSFIPCGKFTVDEPPRSSFHIKLKALDYMMRFDKRVELTKLSFPMSVEALLDKICEICEVEISSDINLASLPNMDQTVMNAPASGDLTYRQILQWIAQITGTCAFMDWNGKLCLSWFTDTGMTLTPSLRYIGGNIDENDITISGVTVGTETKGSADYALLIEGNQLIYPGTEEALAENIYNAIKGLTYRPFACNCIPMPFLYPLDIVSYEELNGNIIQTVITNHNFGLNKASALSAVGETATQSGYSSVKGLTKAEIDSAIREAMKGVDAKAEHIHIKYSQYKTGVDINGNAAMTDKPDANTEYLGTCATNSTSPPDTPSSYKWVKIRGADGKTPVKDVDYFDGKDGGTLQVKYKSSATKPTISNNDVSSWSDVVPAPEKGKRTYMVQKLSTETNWSTPIQISAEDGTTPTVTINQDGYWVINGEATTVKAQGTNGKTPNITVGDNGNWFVDEVDTNTKAQGAQGKDGADIEYVYYRSSSSQTPSKPSYNGTTLSSGWKASPQGITETYKYEYVSVRTKPAGSTSWGEFSTPVIWSKWGEKGTDGDGVEYKYYLSDSPTKPIYSAGDTKWTDEPTGVSASNMYEYVVQITHHGDGTTTLSAVALWSKWGETGDDGRGVSKVVTEYYLSTSETTQTGGSWSEDAPKWVDGRYLWTRLVTYYTDGTNTPSDPVVDASWKKTSVVDAASKELNETLANALGLHVTEYPVGSSKIRYYHSNPSLTDSKEGDTILVFNAKGFGVCTTGWNGGNPVFQNGAEFEKGKAVWNILAANKISADLINAGSIKSLSSAKVQTELNLNSGEATFEGTDVILGIKGVESESSGVTFPEGMWLQSKNADSQWAYTLSHGVIYFTKSYFIDLMRYQLGLIQTKPSDPYYSEIKEQLIKTRDIHCKNIYCLGSDGATEYELLNELTMMAEELNRVSTSLSSLQQKYLELEAELNKPHVHEQGSAVTENYVDSTCAKAGSYDSVVYCTTCGEQISRVSYSIAKKDHSYTSAITKQPTCTEQGTRKYTCSGCGGSYTETIAALGHNYVAVVTPPTETAQGYTTHTCSRCGHSYVDSYTDATGCIHDFNFKVVAPTCTEQGYNEYTCTKCPYSYKDAYKDATGHNDGNGDGFCDACGVQTGTFYTITVKSNNTNYGSVEGGGTFLSGKRIAIIAGANPGYHFVQWNDGNTNEIRTITVTGNATYTAYFEADAVEELTISVGETKRITVDTNNKGGMDNLTESDYTMLKFVAPETAKYEFKSVTAYNPDSSDTFGALFDSTKANRLVYDDQGGSDGHFLFTYDCEAGKTYYFAVKYWALNRGGDIDVKVTKKSTATTYTVTISVSPSGTGTVTGAGTYANGETAYLTASPNDGYEFDYWLIGSGSTQYKSNPLDVYMNGNATVTAVFKVASSSEPTYTTDTIVNGTLYIGLETTDINNTSAYANRTDIVSVVIPDGITSIGHLVFSDCTKLKTITIPASVISIGSAICQRCTALTDVYYKGTETQWNTISIGVNNTNLTNATIHYNS